MKRRGRPALDPDEESVPVHVRMPATVYDDVYARARLDRVTVPERIRRDIRIARTAYSQAIKNRQ